MTETKSMNAAVLKLELAERWKEWKLKLELDAAGRLIHPSGNIATLLTHPDGTLNVMRWRCGILYKMPLKKELLFSVTLEFRLSCGKPEYEVTFDPPIWHPHVDLETGKLEQFFTPRTTCIESILEDLRKQINEPNSIFILITPNIAATKLYISKRSSYNKRFLREARPFDRNEMIKHFDLRPHSHCFVTDLPEPQEEEIQTLRTPLPKFKTKTELMLQAFTKSLERMNAGMFDQIGASTFEE